MTTRSRIDQALVERELAPNLERARRLVMAGRVRIEGQLAVKPDQMVEAGQAIAIKGDPPYVSRAGEKLAVALETFPIKVQGAICADVGASTGGFTDCLLQHGASRVYAIDVGRGQLHWDLRNDPRVVAMERTDARNVGELPEAVSLVTIDVSFISLRLLLDPATSWLTSHGDLIALVKPQFEAPPEEVGRGGVVRSAAARHEVLQLAHGWMLDHGLAPLGLLRSPLLGAKGNQEYLLWARRGGAQPVSAGRLLAGL